GQRDDRPAVVPVQVLAFAVVVEEAVAVAEGQLTRHAVHDASEEYTVGSGISAAAKACRRSAHLLQLPQCWPPFGRMQENVRSSGKCLPRRSTSALDRPR